MSGAELQVPDESMWAVADLLSLGYIDMPTVHAIAAPVVAAELRRIAQSPAQHIRSALYDRADELDQDVS